MEEPHIELLREAGCGGAVPPGALRDAFVRFDHMVEDIAADLKVEYLGPHVGLGRNGGQRIGPRLFALTAR